ncbi:MAG: hypothetical protein WC375_07615 [Methanomassiliicoccales archaeon]|jgi:Arc/MetJ-type ribon-helix-helix transcriptional regulator
METPVVSVRLHPELQKRIDNDVKDGVYDDQRVAIESILSKHYKIKKLPPVDRAKPGRKSKGARSS